MNEASLIEAVKEGATDKVRELIDSGVKVNVHGSEQEWTPLNFAAGKGDLAMVKLLVEAGGANVFKTGVDNRTPYKIAVSAGHAKVARYLAEAEERAGGDQEKASSREFETRRYCAAYQIRDMRRFEGWSESAFKEQEKDEGDDGSQGVKEKRLSDDDIVFLHQDFTVTLSMFHNENVIMNQITHEWQTFCTEILGFKIPDDFDLMPSKQSADTVQDD